MNEIVVSGKQIDIAEVLRNNNEIIRALTGQLEDAEPKVRFYDTVVQTSDTKDFAEVAKILNIDGIGRNNLMAILRDLHVLRSNNEPYQAYVDRGYFKVVEVPKVDYHGITRVYPKTVVYQKGIDYIRRVVLEHLDSDE